MAKKKLNLKAPERVAAGRSGSLRTVKGVKSFKATKGPFNAKAGSGLDAASVSGNMFERLWNRRKFDVLGKKLKGEQKKVGKARSDAVEKRKVSLLQEYKQRGNKNTFVDRRFGEQDEGLGEEEKAIMRFQRERQSQLNRRSKFNLEEDGEGEEDILTHGGQPLSAFDDFDRGGGLDEDDDAENAALGAEMVDRLHFGGGFVPKPRKEEGGEGEDEEEEGAQVPKSKKEVMEEIMAKSKYYKAEHQKQKEADEELREKLDEDFRTLSESAALRTLLRPKKSLDLSVRPKEIVGSEGEGGADAYESLAKSMVFDLRAHAGEKRKDPEEVARGERERLVELEKERLKRMVGGGSSDEEGGDKDGDRGGGGWAGRRRKRQKGMDVSGDDLGDNLMLDETKAGSGWVDQVMARKEEEEEEEEEEDEDEDEDEGEEEEDEGEDEWEQSGSEEEGKGAEGKGEEGKVGVVKEVKAGGAGGELPFVIEAPQSLAEWRAVVDGRGVEEVAEAIRRVRLCNAIALHPSNKRNMQIFYAVLLHYFSSLAGELPLPMDRLDALLPPLLDLAASTPLYAALCAGERLVAMHRQLARKLREGEAEGVSCWPSVRVLFLFRLWALTFPPSDFRHPVITPLLLVGGEYLATCRLRSLKDAAMGLFLCALLLGMVREGRRLLPEALCFLQALLDSALPPPPQGGRKEQYMAAQMGGTQWLYPAAESGGLEAGGQVAPLHLEAVVAMDSSHAFFHSDACRLTLLSICLHTFLAFIRLYHPLPSFPELFSPSLPTLKRLSELPLPEGVERCREEVWGAISGGVRESEALRQPLRMRAKQAVARKQFNPVFEENYAKGRDYDPDRERAEQKKLQRAVKKEARGAARELRKDNYFLAEEKRKEQVEAEGEREEKYKKAMAFLQEQEGAFKSGQLGNAAKKKKRK